MSSSGSNIQQGQQKGVESGLKPNSGIQTRSATGSLPEGGAGVERTRQAAEFLADDKGEKQSDVEIGAGKRMAKEDARKEAGTGSGR